MLEVELLVESSLTDDSTGVVKHPSPFDEVKEEEEEEEEEEDDEDEEQEEEVDEEVHVEEMVMSSTTGREGRRGCHEREKTEIFNSNLGINIEREEEQHESSKNEEGCKAIKFLVESKEPCPEYSSDQSSSSDELSVKSLELGVVSRAREGVRKIAQALCMGLSESSYPFRTCSGLVKVLGNSAGHFCNLVK